MGKLSRDEKMIRQGMASYHHLMHELGPEGVDADYKRRCLSYAPMALPDRELKQFVENVKSDTCQTVTILACAVLRDVFGFSTVRLKRFLEGLNDKADYIVDGDVTWQDWIDTLQEETGIRLSFEGKNRASIRIDKMR